jgi:hypothetical protein
MSWSLEPVESLSEAWVHALANVVASGGRRVHLVMTVTNPGLEIDGVRSVLDQALELAGKQSVSTVAQTIFPSDLYPDPGFDWTPGIAADRAEQLDSAAAQLYRTYGELLPLLLSAKGNDKGTYFARMISWPGKAVGGVNQIDARISRLRTEAKAGRGKHNAMDIDIANDALGDDASLRGVQMYSTADNRTRGFPCMTHIDLTLHDGRLHLLAVYRHHYLVEKAYGNLLGLSWFLQFLCQQSGFEVGELVVHATMADSQKGTFRRVEELVLSAQSALDAYLEQKVLCA